MFKLVAYDRQAIASNSYNSRLGYGKRFKRPHLTPGGEGGGRGGGTEDMKGHILTEKLRRI